MNKIVLSQALKFKDNIPSNNQIKILIEEIKKYQKDNGLYFFDTKHRQKPEILNEKDFFKFLSDINELKINNFEDIEFLLEESISRKESIEKTGDSKEYFAKVFDKVILFQIKDENPILYKKFEDINFDENEDEIEIDENLQNLEKIYEDFLSFNQDYMNKYLAWQQHHFNIMFASDNPTTKWPQVEEEFVAHFKGKTVPRIIRLQYTSGLSSTSIKETIQRGL